MKAHPSYVSVAHHATVEQVIKKSRFIADVFPVTNESETQRAIRSIQERYPDASHVCYAYKQGLDTEVVRFSDAGEPGGTAGRPILEVIEREGLRNTLVTVTRYFGGILLGAAGLVRAYAGATAAVIATVGKARYEWHTVYQVHVGYDAWGRVERLLHDQGYDIFDPAYGVDVTFMCRVRPALQEGWYALLQDATDGSAVVEPVTETYHPMPF